MPIREYECEVCGLAFETIVFSSSTRVSCPACSSEHIERKPSTFGIGGSAKATSANSSSSCSGCHRSSCAGCR